MRQRAIFFCAIAFTLCIWAVIPFARLIERNLLSPLIQDERALVGAALVGGTLAVGYVCLVFRREASLIIRVVHGAVLLLLGFGVCHLVLLPIELVHVLTYSFLALLVRSWLYPAWSSLAAGGVTLAWTNITSVLDETFQGFCPGRVFDIRDLMLNFLGVLATLALFEPVFGRLGGKRELPATKHSSVVQPTTNLTTGDYSGLI